eukprot:2876859-Amphidinium_carterae.2
MLQTPANCCTLFKCVCVCDWHNVQLGRHRGSDSITHDLPHFREHWMPPNSSRWQIAETCARLPSLCPLTLEGI